MTTTSTGRTWPSCWCRSWRRPRGPPSGPSINPRTYLPPTLTHPGTRPYETLLLQAGHGQAAGAGPGGDRGVLPEVLRSTPGPTCLQPRRTRVQDHLKPFYPLNPRSTSLLPKHTRVQDHLNPPFYRRTWPSCWCRSWRRPRGRPSGPSINPRTYLPPTQTHPGTRPSETILPLKPKIYLPPTKTHPGTRPSDPPPPPFTGRT